LTRYIFSVIILHMEYLAQTKQKITGWLAKVRIVLLEVFVPKETNNYLPKALKSKYLFWYGASLLAVKIIFLSLALVLPSTSLFSSITSQQLIAMINQERQARNLSTLTLDSNLNSVAGLKVNDMLAKNYFDHTSPSGITPWYWFKQIGYNYVYAGENLAMGFTETEAVFQAWMNSPTHRDNILNPNYSEIGLAVKSGQILNHEDTLAVLVFGKEQSSAVKTQVAQASPTPSAVAPAAQKTAIPSPVKTTLPNAEPVISNSPVVAAATPSSSPSMANQIELKTIAKEEAPISRAAQEVAQTGYAPRVLGAFVSKSDEIFKSLYLYFTLFLACALLVNIFVKIRIQYWPTVIATTLITLLSAILIFV